MIRMWRDVVVGVNLIPVSDLDYCRVVLSLFQRFGTFLRMLFG
jgi:hypothetical protein